MQLEDGQRKGVLAVEAPRVDPPGVLPGVQEIFRDNDHPTFKKNEFNTLSDIVTNFIMFDFYVNFSNVFVNH